MEQTIKSLLIEKYGFSEAEADKVIRISRMRDAELVGDKLDKIFKFLDIGSDKKTQKSIITRWPQVLNTSVEAFASKAEFYSNEYGINKTKFAKMACRNFSVINSSEKKVKEIEKYYTEKWHMTKEEFVKKMLRVPALVGFPPSTIDSRFNTLKEEYDMQEYEFEKMVKSASNFPVMSVEDIRDLQEFYAREFGITKGDFRRMLMSIKPLTYGTDKVLNGYKKIAEKHDISAEEYGSMLVRCPTLLGFSPAMIDAKFKKYAELGIDDESLVRYPRALVPNPDCLKMRYMFGKIHGLSDTDFLNRGFMCSEKRLFARSMYMREVGLSKSYLYYSEGKFLKRTGVSSETLEKENPYTDAVKKAICERYNNMFDTNVELTEGELNYES